MPDCLHDCDFRCKLIIIMHVHGSIVISGVIVKLRRLCRRWDDFRKETWQETFHALVCRCPYCTLTLRPLILSHWRRYKQTGRIHDQQHILQRFRYSFVLCTQNISCVSCFVSVLHLLTVRIYPHSSNGLTNPGLESRRS